MPGGEETATLWKRLSILLFS